MSKKKKIKLNPNTPINEIIDKYPLLVDIMQSEFEFHCVNCIFSEFDTLEQGAEIHGIVGEDFKEMVEYLEKYLNNEINLVTLDNLD